MVRLQRSRLFPISLIVVDVDGLKKVNDTQGHNVGDVLLRQAAQVMQTTFRPEDMIARIGGDEFVVILPETDKSAVQTAVQRLIKNLEQQNRSQSESLPINLSIGFATCVDHHCQISEIFKKADRAMYLDKDQKKQSEN
jgi:diguanylate cyclase (GGDEF)-like protein